MTKGSEIWAAAPLCAEGCCEGPTYLSPGSRRRPRFHSGCLFSRSPRCRRTRSRSLGRKRRLGSPLFRCRASRQSTGGTSPADGTAIRGKPWGEELGGGGAGALPTKRTIPAGRSGSTQPTSSVCEGLRGLCLSVCPAACPALSSGPKGLWRWGHSESQWLPVWAKGVFLGKSFPKPKAG